MLGCAVVHLSDGLKEGTSLEDFGCLCSHDCMAGAIHKVSIQISGKHCTRSYSRWAKTRSMLLKRALSPCIRACNGQKVFETHQKCCYLHVVDCINIELTPRRVPSDESSQCFELNSSNKSCIAVDQSINSSPPSLYSVTTPTTKSVHNMFPYKWQTSILFRRAREWNLNPFTVRQCRCTKVGPHLLQRSAPL